MHLSLQNSIRRVALQFRQSRSRNDPRDPLEIWKIPSLSPGIPDEIVVQHSDGCTVTCEDVEILISETQDIVRGSCKFKDVHASDMTNRITFELLSKMATNYEDR